jgi:hypothetical protein
MSTALNRPMSLAEFLEWEERQPAKHAFDGFGPVATVGVSEAHALAAFDALALPELGIQIPLSEFHAGLVRAV